MSIQNVLTELWPAITQQQGQKAVQALAATINMPPQGMTNAQLAEPAIKRFVKAVVRGGERSAKEIEIAALQAVVDQEFPEV